MSRIFEKLFFVFVLFFASGGLRAFLAGNRGKDMLQGTDTRVLVVWVCIYAVVLVLCFFRIKKIFLRVTADPWLALLLGFVLISTLWSRDSALSVGFALALVATSMVGFYLSARFSQQEQLELLACALGLGMILSLFTALLLPEVAYVAPFPDSLRGIFIQKNWLAKAADLSIATFLVLKPPSKFRIVCRVLCGLSVLLVILSRSGTGYIVLGALSVAYFTVRHFKNKAGRAFVSAVGSFLILTMIFSYLEQGVSTILSFLGKDSTLSGRTELWALTLSSWTRQPYLGYGYGGFWRGLEGADLRATLRWDAPDGHNGFLDTLIELGLVGIALLCATLVPSIKRSLSEARKRNFASSDSSLLFLCFLLFYNLTEDTLMMRNSLGWILYVMVASGLAFRAGTFNLRTNTRHEISELDSPAAWAPMRSINGTCD